MVAGFPWFTDWGRDTFIAMRGLLLATGRLAEAEAILSTWSGLVDQGMLPNRCSESDGDGRNTTRSDASLWFVVAVDEFLRAAAAAGYQPRDEGDGWRRRSRRSSTAICAGHALRDRARRGRPRCVPASPACSSPGWTPRWAIGW